MRTAGQHEGNIRDDQNAVAYTGLVDIVPEQMDLSSWDEREEGGWHGICLLFLFKKIYFLIAFVKIILLFPHVVIYILYPDYLFSFQKCQ